MMKHLPKWPCTQHRTYYHSNINLKGQDTNVSVIKRMKELATAQIDANDIFLPSR